MQEHKDDFCYWINKPLLDRTYFGPLDIENTNLISAMFIIEIGTNGTHGITWSSWKSSTENNFRERNLGLKGILFSFKIIDSKISIY